MPLIVDEASQLQKIVLQTAQGQSSEVFLHGAHVTSWKTPQGEELLFVSSLAVFKPPTAIRGGIPVCFPQFGKLGPVAAQHGFARNQAFEVEELTEASVTLVLRSDGHHAVEWPHPCELRVTVALIDDDGGSLQQTLAVKNTGTGAITFTTALHTYFSVGDVRQVTVKGLQGVTYLDSLQGGLEVEERGDAVPFAGEVDRIYRATPHALQVHDASRQRVFEVVKDAGFPDAVVWNPHVEKAKTMGDFGDDDWPRMVCLEVALAASGAATVAPGAGWSAMQTLRVRSAL